MRVSLAPSSPGEVLGLLRHVFRPTPTPEQSFNPGLQSAVPGQSKTASRSSDVDLDISVHVEKVGESPTQERALVREERERKVTHRPLEQHADPRDQPPKTGSKNFPILYQ